MAIMGLLGYSVCYFFSNFGFMFTWRSFIETGLPRVLGDVIFFLFLVLKVGYGL